MTADPWSPTFDNEFGPLGASPSGTIVTIDNGGTITDTAGNVWSLGHVIPATASVAVNGDVETSTGGIVEMAYVNGEVWIYNTHGKWQGKSTPAAPWLPQAGTTVSPFVRGATKPRNISIVLPGPEVFHPGQLRAYEVFRRNRFVVGRCGRRWGKTDFAKFIACDAASKGEIVGWFAPDYKRLSEAQDEISRTLQPVKDRSSKMEGIFRTINGNGHIDFWTLLDESAGRSRRYHKVIIDEAAFTKPNMMAIWERSIEPTLLDYSGKCLVISNTNGVAEDNFLHQICEPDDIRPPGTPGKNYGFVEFHAPSHENPFVPKRKPGETEAEWRVRQEADFARIKARKHPLVFLQEYLAEFVNFSGISFFSRDKLLLDGAPVPYPDGCEQVFAVIDTAVKEGQEHDGTAVSYWAKMPDWFTKYKLVCLDWDIVSIDGALLEVWIRGVYERLEELARECRAMYGSTGANIEDAQSGSILLQQCALRGWRAEPLPTQLTAAGKDTRAINAADPVYRGEVKFSAYAMEKTKPYRDIDRNHMLSQVSGFRVGDKLAAKRADDLLDTFCYAVAISCGGAEGIA